MAKKFRKTLNTENCDEFSLSADGPDIDVDDSKEGLLELTIKYPLHTLHVEAEELREPVEVSAKWGSVLAEKAVEAVAVQGLNLAVCGSCRYFLQTHLAAEWSKGFSGYCRASGTGDLGTVVDIFHHCEKWSVKDGR